MAGVRVTRIEVVVLQIAGDIVGEHFERLHLHRAGADRLERHAERFAGGQNHAVADEAHAGLGHPQHQILRELAVQAGPRRAAQAGADGQGDGAVVPGLATRVDQQLAAVDANLGLFAVNPHQPGGVLVAHQGL